TTNRRRLAGREALLHGESKGDGDERRLRELGRDEPQADERVGHGRRTDGVARGGAAGRIASHLRNGALSAPIDFVFGVSSETHLRVRGLRLVPRSSKPLTGRRTFRGGFDSHALSQMTAEDLAPELETEGLDEATAA